MVKKPRLFIALCTLPALILTIVFMIVPMVNAIYLSFTSSTALSVGFNSKFVFLDNYRYMFQDKDFLQALFNTLKLMLVIPAVTIFLSLVFAFILTQGQLKEKSFYRTVFFFPSIVSMTVVGIVWSFVFNPTRGILNHMLDLFHLSTWKHAWLGEGKTALWCIGAALVWQAIGYYMVMHVASIDGISQEVYEAASIDGATGVQKFFKITIPLASQINWNDLYTFPVWYYQLKFYPVQCYDRWWTKRCFQCTFTVYVYPGYAKRQFWICHGDRHVYPDSCNRACNDF